MGAPERSRAAGPTRSRGVARGGAEDAVAAGQLTRPQRPDEGPRFAGAAADLPATRTPLRGARAAMVYSARRGDGAGSDHDNSFFGVWR
jgi:hypothetical protein